MENEFSDVQKEEEESMDRFTDDMVLDETNGLDCSEIRKTTMVRRANSQGASQIINVKCIKNNFLRSARGLDAKIPKHMVTLDERYLRRCLELIHTNALKSAKCNANPNPGYEKVNFLWDDVNSAKIKDEGRGYSSRFVFEYALTTGIESVIISSEGQWILGSVMGSKSMINLLKSPLLSKFGFLDGSGKVGRIGLNDGVKRSVNNDIVSSPGRFSGFSSQKPDNETLTLGDSDLGFKNRHKRLASVSSTDSTFSDRSSSAASGCSYTGMLQCIWKNEHPHFVFSVDDRKEVYVANLSGIKSGNGKGLDYMYSFNWRKNQHSESILVGKMEVSTSFALCPNNSNIMETKFTLSCSNESSALEMQMSGNASRKNKGFSKKVAEKFKSNHLFRQRTFSKFGSSGTILEDSLWEPWQTSNNNTDEASSGSSLSYNHLVPNLQMAAVIVKEHLPESQPEEVGGWGLKFLEKVRVKQQNNEEGCCARDNGDCSTSMDVLIPAGFHGGPRTRNGGPSGLIERWRSGGICDCGGWDLGCPLTVLNTKVSKKEGSMETDTGDTCKSVDLLTQVILCSFCNDIPLVFFLMVGALNHSNGFNLEK